MEKLQIQFKESDYKVYYDYCFKYYQVHNTVRIQSIHLFLDLFEKEIIPVEERNISQARQFFSAKCDALKKTRNDTVEEGENTILLQMRICSDLLLLCDDLEKIFQLIQKHGVVANYLMILGTFSRVIEENRNLQLAGMYDLKSDVIESLAKPLANIIRQRLGTDRDWHLVLHELAVIATRFNQRYAEPKFDLEIIQIVGPAVVARFDKKVENREILSVLSSCFEECELEAFEAFLNRTPEGGNNEHDDDIYGDTLYALIEPLKGIAGAITAQRDRWAQGRPGLSGQYSLPLQTGTQSPGVGVSPAGSGALSFPGQPSENGYKTFDIVVRPDVTTQVESPFKVYPISDSVPEKDSVPLKDSVPVKSRIRPFVPAIIGVLVILLFIIGTMIISGGWNPVGAGHPENSTPAKNVTTVKPTPVKSATTAKPTPAKTTLTPTPTPTPQFYSLSDIKSHLSDITSDPYSTVLPKPTGNVITISISGSYNNNDVALLNDFIHKFNIYSATTQLSSNASLEGGQGGANGIRLLFEPESMLNQMPFDDKTVIYKDPQTGEYYFVQNGLYEFVNKITVKTYINSGLKGNERNRWTLRALLFNLGFTGTTGKYPDSLFYAGSNNATQLSTIDWDAIQLMFNHKIT
jgi:hypothetical protein